jgi:hypothetical protein
VTLRHEGWLKVMQPITVALDNLGTRRSRAMAATIQAGPWWAHRRV